MEITSVKKQQNGYLVNNSISVPEGHSGWITEPLNEWLKTNTPEPEFTEDELKVKAEAEAIATWKANRQNLVDNIEVTYNGIIYQGDEVSQTRMSRTITALPDDTITIPWVAKDNTVHSLNRVELKGLLFQAGLEQSTIWNEGRPE